VFELYSQSVPRGGITQMTLNRKPTESERLDRLERSNRRLKAAFLVCACCVLALIVMGAVSSAPKVVEAQKIILRDGAGNERGELFASDASWGLVLFNKNKTKAASLVVGSEANGLLLFDQNGNVRQALTADLNESAWSVLRPGSDSAQFAVTDNPLGTALSVRDRANVDRITLGISQRGAGIGVADADGATRSFIDSQLGFITFAKDGTLEWSPGLDKFSPEEQKRLKELIPKLPK
jgi:hypothetical protein